MIPIGPLAKPLPGFPTLRLPLKRLKVRRPELDSHRIPAAASRQGTKGRGKGELGEGSGDSRYNAGWHIFQKANWTVWEGQRSQGCLPEMWEQVISLRLLSPTYSWDEEQKKRSGAFGQKAEAGCVSLCPPTREE